MTPTGLKNQSTLVVKGIRKGYVTKTRVCPECLLNKNRLFTHLHMGISAHLHIVYYFQTLQPVEMKLSIYPALWIIALTILLSNCARSPYHATNKSYKKQAKALAKEIRRNPAQQAISAATLPSRLWQQPRSG
jgi:hypothetical protein